MNLINVTKELGMNTYQIIELIINGLTALGTVGAVIVSLWLARPHWQRYTIKDVRVSCIINGADNSQKSAMLIMLANHQNVPMEIQYIALRFRCDLSNSTSEKSWKCTQEFIPPLSQYEIKADIIQEWAPGLISKADEITLSLKTSLGDKTIKFPKNYLAALTHAMEVPKTN